MQVLKTTKLSSSDKDAKVAISTGPSVNISNDADGIPA
jgi:hypothetical protein